MKNDLKNWTIWLVLGALLAGVSFGYWIGTLGVKDVPMPIFFGTSFLIIIPGLAVLSWKVNRLIERFPDDDAE